MGTFSYLKIDPAISFILYQKEDSLDGKYIIIM